MYIIALQLTSIHLHTAHPPRLLANDLLQYLDEIHSSKTKKRTNT